MMMMMAPGRSLLPWWTALLLLIPSFTAAFMVSQPPPFHLAKTTTTSTTSLFGIPKMFRWLTDQYPDIIHRQLESDGLDENLVVDNLYLDMNGIIHPCTHGNSEERIVLDETAMFKKIFLYVDRLYKLVRPTVVLHLAVDGVAPRAKMNQQRSRRFRSAKEAEVAAAERVARGIKDESGSTTFDSNCITPGTDFMLKLSLALQKWVEFKIETDPVWRNGADVIVSGPDVPGEGEHKVMDFIRNEKAKPDSKYYRENMVHVLYGLDADLVMLGLVTHETNFMLLREKMSVVMAGRRGRKQKDMLEYDQNDFELLELGALREMLNLQFEEFQNKLDVDYSLERIIDDFVFMCMLVGNDFLPHMPHMEIDKGALSVLMNTYTDLVLDSWRGYLTDKVHIYPDRFEEFVYHLAAFEEEHFKRRSYEEKEPGWKLSANDETDPEDFYGKCFGGAPTPDAAKSKTLPKEEIKEMAPTGNREFRRLHPNNLSRSYRDFYYQQKFGWNVESRAQTLWHRRQHAKEYLAGLHWNLNYYHKGCQSWDWYFPYLYAPLATDLVNLDELYDKDCVREDGFATIPFDKGTPFPSLAQLLSVLPPQSAKLLPEPLGELMTHPSSPLGPYYPMDFDTDSNGKRQSWEAIVKIPFIDAELLLDTVSMVVSEEGSLSPGEQRRNTPGQEHIFVAPRDGDEEVTKWTKRKSQSNDTTVLSKKPTGAAKSKGSKAPTQQRRTGVKTSKAPRKLSKKQVDNNVQTQKAPRKVSKKRVADDVPAPKAPRKVSKQQVADNVSN